MTPYPDRCLTQPEAELLAKKAAGNYAKYLAKPSNLSDNLEFEKTGHRRDA
jgi:hypothetical protein